jgi:hypothetical protein
MRRLQELLNEQNTGSVHEHWHIRCICHVICRAVKYAEVCVKDDVEKVRELLKRVRYSSAMRIEFRDVQVRMGRTSIITVPALDFGKDWNSLFTFINKCYELRAVFEALRNLEKFAHDLKGCRVQDTSWSVLKSVCDFLRIAKVMTDMASSRSYVTISLQPVIYNSIVSHCDRTVAGQSSMDFTTPHAKMAAETMKAKMVKYRHSLCAHLPMLALFLDPSRDRSIFDPHGNMIDVVRSLLRTECGMETAVTGYEE